MAPLLPDGLRVVLLDALGTLLALAPPGPALTQVLRERHGLRLEAADAERAFAAEIAYYRAHHREGRDAATLADLRARCAEVLRGALPPAIGRALNPGQLTQAMLGALRFAAYRDAPEALRALRARRLRLVVVSNWDVSLPAVLADSGLAELLDGVVTSAAIGAAKPDPEIFRAALALAGVPARRALHVGDSPTLDVAGARAAGIAAVLLHRDAGARPGGAWAASSNAARRSSADRSSADRSSADRSPPSRSSADPAELTVATAGAGEGAAADAEAGLGAPVIYSLGDLLA